MDTVGTAGDGLGLLRFRLYVPEHIQEGEDYPLVATLGGLGSTNSFANNGYASRGSAFASDAFQAEHPCYVLNITVPYEPASTMRRSWPISISSVRSSGPLRKATAM